MERGNVKPFFRSLFLTMALALLSGCAMVGQMFGEDNAAGSYRPVVVLFATDRSPAAVDDEQKYFSGGRGPVSYGRALIDVPMYDVAAMAKHRFRGFSFWGNLRIADARIQAVEALTKAEFLAAIVDDVDEAKSGSLMLFVPGYNTGFEEALNRTAQLHWDTRFPGHAVLFSWPSVIAVTGYTADEASVDWSTPHLVSLLKTLKEEVALTNVALIAHSMGSRALTRSLIEVERDSGIYDAVDHVVLAAPDIDSDIFVRDIAPNLVKGDRSITLYASSRDRALNLSHQLHRYPRAGDAGPGLIVYPGIDTIDATEADTSFLGHNYYGENYSIMTDLRSLFGSNAIPHERPGLEPAHSAPGSYWRLVPEVPTTP